MLFIRHAESAKNLNENFDGDVTLDILTSRGRERAEAVARLLAEMSGTTRIKAYCANSGRAQETARILIYGGCENLNVVDAFGSMRSGPISGLNDESIAEKFPHFFQDLQLFRAGVLSGYSVRKPDGAEKWMEYERRLSAEIELVENDVAPLKLVVCHRSAMIAILNHFARAFLKFPSSHLGFVNAPPLFAALVRPNNAEFPIIVGDANTLLEYME